jgi:uncharacterized membrane protein
LNLSVKSVWNDRKVEDIIGNLLRAGVILSATIVFLGAVIYLFRHGSSPASYRVFQGEPSELRQPRGIVHGAFAFSSRGIMQLGILLLIATPILRVAFSVFAFIAERDRMYVIFTLIVLSVLLYSVIGTG